MKKLFEDISKAIDSWEGGDKQLLKQDILLRIDKEFGVDDDFVTKFRDLFPKKRLPSGKQFRSNAKDLKVKLKSFMKEYGYGKEVILKAAENYVEHAERVDYQFIKTASYFIHKREEGSEMADWCEEVGDESESTTTSVQTII